MENLYNVPDREPLRTFPGGMVVTRAIKHEPIDLTNRTREQIAYLTNHDNGGKFLAAWPLTRVVDWVEQEVARRGWRFPPGAGQRLRIYVDVEEPVGVSCGKTVSTICLMLSGRYIHALPAEETS